MKFWCKKDMLRIKTDNVVSLENDIIDSHELIRAWITTLRGWSMRVTPGLLESPWWILRNETGEFVGEFPSFSVAIRFGLSLIESRKEDHK